MARELEVGRDSARTPAGCLGLLVLCLSSLPSSYSHQCDAVKRKLDWGQEI